MNYRILIIFITFLLSNILSADCIEFNNKTSGRNNRCVTLNETTYYSKHIGGEAHIFNDIALCGAGKCLAKDGNLYCSQFPGGGIIENNGALWTGPGECIKHNGDVQKNLAECASRKMILYVVRVAG